MSNKLHRNYIRAYSKLELLAKQIVEGFITGLHKSPLHGFSVEFAEHRQYNNGESTRHIDWKLYARTEKLFLKRYEEETNLRCQILIDNSASMYFPFNKEASFENPNKITYAVYAAAAIIEMLKKQRDAVGLSLFTDKINLHFPAKSSPQHIQLLMSHLEQVLIDVKPTINQFTNASKVIHEIANIIHKRSLVIIFSDMLDAGSKDEVYKSLQHLKHNKHEVILFHIVDAAKELELEFKNRPYKFVDSESGEILKINPKEIKDFYVAKMMEFKDDLKLKCFQYNIDFVEVDINKGFHEVLLPYFLKREKLY
ncbi:MAG: hypothetical protein AUJ98_06970 [Bacteroidetes bacterium CG2_30_33_31]|nr:MAG: hypothetical protein AUJ98_06970 [Bacteroidetes bacterium CG2_30_33_31]